MLAALFEVPVLLRLLFAVGGVLTPREVVLPLVGIDLVLHAAVLLAPRVVAVGRALLGHFLAGLDRLLASSDDVGVRRLLGRGTVDEQRLGYHQSCGDGGRAKQAKHVFCPP